jgi:hypothetical protein
MKKPKGQDEPTEQDASTAQDATILSHGLTTATREREIQANLLPGELVRKAFLRDAGISRPRGTPRSVRP